MREREMEAQVEGPGREQHTKGKKGKKKKKKNPTVKRLI